MQIEIKDEQKGVLLNEPEKVFGFIVELWGQFPDYEKERENMFVLYMNTKNKLIAVELSVQGTIDQAVIYQREVFRKGLALNAASFILIHNHPSDDITPSREDIALTRRIKEGANTIGIDFCDHIIIPNNGTEYYSFQKEGKII